MAENLNYEAPGSKCYSGLDINCATYGRLYNWPTIMNASNSSAALPSGTQGICPDGWHLPSDPEWAVLIDYVGNTPGTKLKANSVSWSSNTGTDYYGFSALPGGRGTSDGAFNNTSNYGYWWSSSEYNNSNAHVRYIIGIENGVSRTYFEKGYFLSVRCVKDGYVPPNIPSHPNNGTPLVDSRDNKTYRTIKIGTQTWMAENLNYSAPGSKCYTNNDANCGTYGRLYNWATAVDLTLGCPAGWRLPTDTDWSILIDYANSIQGTQLKANSVLWASNTGTDALGFSALPGGRGTSDGTFNNTSSYGYWWSSSEYNNSNAYVRYIIGIENGVSKTYFEKGYFLSVRCIQGSE